MNALEPQINTSNAASQFSLLTLEGKASFLARLAHEVTILARDTYEAGGNGLTNPERMRVLNEVQHRILGFLVALLRADPKRYPDDILVQIVLEHPDDSALERQLFEAFDRAMSASCAAT